MKHWKKQMGEEMVGSYNSPDVKWWEDKTQWELKKLFKKTEQKCVCIYN